VGLARSFNERRPGLFVLSLVGIDLPDMATTAADVPTLGFRPMRRRSSARKSTPPRRAAPIMGIATSCAHRASRVSPTDFPDSVVSACRLELVYEPVPAEK